MPCRGAADALVPRGNLPLKGGPIPATSALHLGGAVPAGTSVLSGARFPVAANTFPSPHLTAGSAFGSRACTDNEWVVLTPGEGRGGDSRRQPRERWLPVRADTMFGVTPFPGSALLSQRCRVGW